MSNVMPPLDTCSPLSQQQHPTHELNVGIATLYSCAMDLQEVLEVINRVGP
jgi:hypothetical protein